MITLFGQELEIYQAVLLVYIVGYGLVLGVSNTCYRVFSLLTGKSLNQSDLGKLTDGLWYGAIFILVGTLV